MWAILSPLQGFRVALGGIPAPPGPQCRPGREVLGVFCRLIMVSRLGEVVVGMVTRPTPLVRFKKPQKVPLMIAVIRCGFAAGA